MRSIDADSFKKYDNEHMPQGSCMLLPVIEGFLKCSDGCPTIELVKHGHWFKNDRDWQCSVCGEICNRVYDSYEQKRTDYCGCCGAKMDEKVSE